MGKLDDVKLTIDANIRENGNEDITGGVLNLVLTDVIEAAEVELVQLGNRVSVLEQNGGGSGGGGGSIDPALLEGYLPMTRDYSDDFNNDFAR